MHATETRRARTDGMRPMTEGTPWRLMLAFAAPVLIGLLLQQLYNTVDAVVVGNFDGEDALAAVGSTGCLVMLFLAIANGFSAGAGVIVAQHFGAGRRDEMMRSASTAVVLLLVMGAVSTVIGVVACGPVLELVLGTPADLMDMAEAYFAIYALSLVFQFGYNIVAGILRAVGDSRATLYFLLIASVLNIILAVVFVGAFDWGVEGAAAATGVSQCVCCLAAFAYMNSRYPEFRFVPSTVRFERGLAREALRVGLPMAMQQAIVSLGFFFLQHAVNSYGESMTASFTVGQRLETYLSLPAMSLQVTMATYSAQNIGAGRMDRVDSGMRQAIVLSLGLSLVLSAAVYALAPWIVGAFGLSGTAAEYANAHVTTSAVAMLVFSLYFPVLGLYQGAKVGFVATAVATTVLAVRVLVTYTLCEVPALDYQMIWLNQFFGFAVGIAITFLYLRSGRWRVRANASGRTGDAEEAYRRHDRRAKR